MQTAKFRPVFRHILVLSLLIFLGMTSPGCLKWLQADCETTADGLPNLRGEAALSVCEVFKHLNWDRPFDIGAVIDVLERMNQQGEFRGKINVDQIAVGGHSAGAGGALSVAGALRNFSGTPVSPADPRPVAFLAFSPQAPGAEGFFDTDFKQPTHSWQPISRPVLIGTGDGDNGCKTIEEPGNCLGDTPYRPPLYLRSNASG